MAVVASPPAPVTAAVQGVSAAPVKSTEVGQVTVTTAGAGVMVKDFGELEGVWLASPE